MNLPAFVVKREELDDLMIEIKILLAKEYVDEAKPKIELAGQLLADLSNMASSDEVQQTIIANRVHVLRSIDKLINEIRKPKKKAKPKKKTKPKKKVKPKKVVVRWTQKEAVDCFLERFPRGYRDPFFLRSERQYKIDAHEKFEERFGDGQAEKLLKQDNIPELTDRFQHVFLGKARPSML